MKIKEEMSIRRNNMKNTTMKRQVRRKAQERGLKECRPISIRVSNFYEVGFSV